MSTLREDIYVNCPPAQAHLHIDAFFREHTAPAHDLAEGSIRLTLRVPLRIPGLKTALTVQRGTIATIKRVHAGPSSSDTLSVTWEALGGGPFPRFAGTISVRGDEDYDSFRLMLEGMYAPPLGVAGNAFDSVIGRWLAIATARDLLGRMRDSIETSYRQLEAEKAARVHAGLA
ncbi:MAG TPA: hypothetical protein VME66_14715 [Candidatus Acidoferrales bacterium]|nr:hypothetical protein [Candidatus Acidoferrales bacterium]